MRTNEFAHCVSTAQSTKPIASITIAIVSAFGYFAAWSLLASPFVSFPGDDVYVATKIAGDQLMRDSSAPVYYWLAYLALKFCGIFANSGGCDAGKTILQLAIASNATIVLLLGMILFQLTKNIYVQSIGHAIYAFSAWPVTYHFMISYTVTTAALILLVFYLIIVSNRKSRLLPGIAGIAAALALWTSPAGPLTVGLLLIAVGFLMWNGNSAKDLLSLSCFELRRFSFFIISFLVVGSFFGYFGFQPYLDHLLHNINTPHYIDAYKKFGFIPESPFFSYLHILKVYGYMNLILFISALIAVPILLIKPIIGEAEKHKIRVVLVLTGFVILHALLIDLLPTTKLARAHFPSYPVSLIVMCLIGFAGYRWAAKPVNTKILLAVFLGVTLSAHAYEGVRIDKETRHVRVTAEQYLNNARATTEWYLLQEDPHHGLMWTTFNWSSLDIKSIHVSTQGLLSLQGRFKPGQQHHVIQLIEASKAQSLIANKNRKPIGLILGPHGPGSGLSVANHATFDDFNINTFLKLDVLRPRIKEITLLPYYMHYPPFLLEEEITEALYFSGQIPDYRAPEMGITLIKF